MVGAMIVPEETQVMIRDVFVAMADDQSTASARQIASDLASGAALLLAASEGAFLNVRINAAYLTNRELAEDDDEACDVGARRDSSSPGCDRGVRRQDAGMSQRAPLLLCVLDGFGEAPAGPGNAIDAKPNRSFWNETCARSTRRRCCRRVVRTSACRAA